MSSTTLGAATGRVPVWVRTPYDRCAPVDQVRARMAELAGDPSVDPGARMLHRHLESGGKQLRARLALASCEALGGRVEDAIDWAAAVELLHNGSLVHDDIQDGDRVRRGRPALWTEVGAAQAINAGDLLLMLPYRALSAYSAVQQAALAQILAKYADMTVRGQIRELGLSARPEEGWAEYFAAASGKTGTLFALPVRGSAAIVGVEPALAEELAATFASIGVLYQLQDDVLDLTEAKGRGSSGSDLFEGRLSAVVLAHFDVHPHDRKEVLAFLSMPRRDKSDADVARFVSRFQRGGAVERLIRRIDVLAADLLQSGTLVSFPAMRDVAQELIASVLSPLEAVRPRVRRTRSA